MFLHARQRIIKYIYYLQFENEIKTQENKSAY